MPPAKTSGNHPETLSDHDTIVHMLEHIDTQLHDLDRKLTGVLDFIDLHRPALARGLALMDPGAKVRAMLPIRKAKV